MFDVCFFQDGTGKINTRTLGTVLQCCGLLEIMQCRFRRGRRESKWEMFDAPAKQRRGSKWDAFDSNIFSPNQSRSSIYDMNSDIEHAMKVPKKDVSFSSTQTSRSMESKIGEEGDKREDIIGEMMSLIDHRNTGMVEFPEFIETITVKILQDAAIAGYKGI